MKIAFISVGVFGHGHNVAFTPNAIITIAKAVQQRFLEMQLKVFDQVLDGDGDDFELLLERFAPDALMVGVPVSGYYDKALRLYAWARNRNIPVLTGGFHFCVPDKNGTVPGEIARIATEAEGVVVCCGDGESASIGWIAHLLDPEVYPLKIIPNICFSEEGRVAITSERHDFSEHVLPRLSETTFDPRRYWKVLSSGDVQSNGHDCIDGNPVIRTAVAPRIVVGCTYREARLKVGKEACGYCTLSAGYQKLSPQFFWNSTMHLWNEANAYAWQGGSAMRIYQTGDDMASDISFIHSLWQTRPVWLGTIPLAHRMYARYVANEEHARMLYDIGVRWLYIGADGKKGFTSEWSEHHPLVRTLTYCQQVGITVSLGFVLGQYGQDWDEIELWRRFKNRIVERFAETLILVDGWVNVVAPGSPDWNKLCDLYPHFCYTDRPDLEEARLCFWRSCTQLCKDGLSPEQVREKLYAMVPEFEMQVSQSRHFMLRP